MRRRLSYLALVLLIAALLPAAAGAAAGEPTTITLIHDTHMHGNFGSGHNTIAHKAGVINEIRRRKPDALFVGNGDDLATSILSGEFRGSHMVDAFNQMKLAVNTIGNHEFDLGPENLLERVKEAKFPWVSANLRDKRTGDVFGAEVGVKRFIILEANGVKVGITGLAPIATPNASSPGPNLKVLGYAEAMREVLPEMQKAGAQVTVMLSHICGAEAEALAAEVDGIDVIVGDHCATVLEQPKRVGRTIISRVGDEFRYVGELTLTVLDGKVTDFQFTRHEITANVTADPVISALMERYQGTLAAKLSEVVGRTSTPLDAMKLHNRIRETSLGNFVADAAREAVAADVAIINGGNIRAEKVYQPGPLTKKDVLDSLPFPNTLVKLAVSGATLAAALEHGVSTVTEGSGKFPQVSGLSFRFAPTLPAGQQVRTILVNGKPLDPAATYTLATNSFMAGGGDGYEMLTGAEVLLDANSGPLLSTVVTDAIRKAGVISPTTTGRILYLEGVTLEAGKAALQIAGHAQPIDVAPEMKDGELYVPVRWVTELYGATVGWEQATRTASVTMPWGKGIVVQAGRNGYIRSDRMLVAASDLAVLGIRAVGGAESVHLALE